VVDARNNASMLSRIATSVASREAATAIVTLSSSQLQMLRSPRASEAKEESNHRLARLIASRCKRSLGM
jgi:hypothetical protein